MNCDTAFDLMTDPHGSRSGALAEHFAACPRCRRMQETLAPALEFLADDSVLEGTGRRGHELSVSSSGREPFVTAEAVQVARQAAAGLALRAEMPRVRLARLAGRSARYAAAFAAGLLLAVVLFIQRDSSAVHGGTCTRREASKDDPLRTPEQVRVLAQSCAVCHQTAPARSDDQSLNNPTRRTGSWDWLLPILENQPQPAFENPGFEPGQMMAAKIDRPRLPRELV